MHKTTVWTNNAMKVKCRDSPAQ